MPANSFHLRSYQLMSSDNIAIHVNESVPATSSNAVLILHGATEYGERYIEFAQYLYENGIGCVMMDLRGFGRSGGKRAYWPDFNASASDVAMVASSIQDRGFSLHLLGHSMGGLLAARCAATLLKDRIRTLNLSSPCFEVAVKVPGWQVLAARVLSFAYPAFIFPTPVKPENLTHDPEVIKAYLGDPLLTHKMTARLYTELLKNTRQSVKFSKNISCPTLILQAAEDIIVSVSASELFYKNLTANKKHFRIIPSARHEILQEVGRQQTYKLFLDHIRNNTV